MSVHRIRFEGPSTLAVSVATALAEADGVELLSSEALAVDGDLVTLVVDVEGIPDAVADAVAGIQGRLPRDASIAIVD